MDNIGEGKVAFPINDRGLSIYQKLRDNCTLLVMVEHRYDIIVNSAAEDYQIHCQK